MYASIKDVAALAGVSFQTASKVLNGKAGVASAATNDRILSAADELGYVPNALARGLVHQISPTVGIVSDDLADMAIARFVNGAQQCVEEAGHTALVVGTPAGGDRAAPLRRLQEHRVQGILVVAPSLESDARFAAALPRSVPVVSLSSLAGTSASVVGSDHRRTGALVAHHLAALGHRTIATVTGAPDRRVTVSRLAGFQAALEEAGIVLDPAAVVTTDWTSGGACRATHRLLELCPGVTAIFAHTDLMALGVLHALQERRVRVPDDCSVVGCDDLAIAEFLSPPLTTVRIPFEETGARAATLLLRTVAGEPIPHRDLLPVSLVLRASSARPPPLPAARRTIRPRTSPDEATSQGVHAP